MMMAPAPSWAQSALAESTSGTPGESSAIVRDEAAIASAWGYAASDLTPDPAVRFGVLPNGMRYAIRKNATPPGTAVMRLLIDTGSTSEAEDERGLAHFIEHMAFNGTTNVPEGEMIKILERLGLEFGADTNAFTSYDQTGYLLDLPNVKAETVDTALYLLRETASEIRFEPEAIERERGVILSEMRTRANYAQRNRESLFAFTVPDTRIATRSPIGDRAVIETAPTERFRSFYERYYTPGRSTLVVVGDVDVAMIEAKIQASFSNWQATRGEAPHVPLGNINTARTDEANIFTHPAIDEVATAIRFSPYVEEPDSKAARRAKLTRALAYNIVGRRLGRIARQENAPFVGASIGRSDVYKIANQSVLNVATRDGEWQRGLAAAEREVRAALRYGFTKAELAEQLANFTTGYENAVLGHQTRPNDQLADQVMAMAKDGMIVTTPESQLERFVALRDALTTKILLKALRNDFGTLDKPLIHLATKVEPAGGADILRTAFAEAQKTKVAKPQTRDAQAFAYQDFGSSGTVVADSTIEDLGIRTVRFANNVRLNLKKTDFDKNRVLVSLRIDGGDLLASRDNPEATSLMNIFVRGGLEAHSLDDLYSIFAGRAVSLNFGSGEDYLGGYLATTPDDLKLQMQVLAAFTTHPGYRSEAINQYRSYLPNFYARMNATPEGAIGSQIGAILSDNDPRFSLADRAVFERLTFDDLKASIGDRLAKGAIEIGLVGDFDEDEAIAAVAATFGALAEREADFRDYGDARMRQFTANRAPRVLHHKGEADQAIVEFYWPTTDDGDYREDVRLRLLAELLQIKVTDQIREQLGASYSPVARSFTSSIYPGYGYIQISTNVATGDVDKVAEAVRQIAAELSAPARALGDAPVPSPIAADELARARTPILENIANSVKSNSAWLGVVDSAQSKPARLDRFRSGGTAFGKVSADELLTMARTYLAPERALLVQALYEDEAAGTALASRQSPVTTNAAPR
ncbi:insulinase family protein [Blastomonas sp. AAP53]|uniref:M16 family metallopeptidase n=1 Tax=Blastomonas sp. AAP53 TaxID=1248760 RepID=UPI000370CC61|nr:insulinase family protein [Blastomonas sp. AAP53]